MNRRVYAYVRIYAFLYAYTRVFIRTYANTYTHIRVYLYAYTRILIRTYAYTYTHIRVYLFAYYTRFLVNVYLSGTVNGIFGNDNGGNDRYIAVRHKTHSLFFIISRSFFCN